MEHEVPTVLPKLQDPSRQIRLLKVTPNDFDAEVQCHVVIHELETAPPFHAISYTWGPEHPQHRILLDSGWFPIRQNCHYALQQVRQHSPGALVWVDSICINQVDNAEKGTQVGIMGDIYSRATRVLACIGEIDESSQFLYNTAKRFELSTEEETRDWSDSDEKTLNAHWKLFSRRSYFRRIWILQELKEGMGRIDFLCGTETLEWESLFKLMDFQKDITSQLYHLRNATCPEESLGLVNVIIRCSESLCLDPRDRIYGTLRLVDWESSPCPKPVPDYTLSRWDLAIKLLGDGHFETLDGVRQLVVALALNQHDFNHHNNITAPIALQMRSWESGFPSGCMIDTDASGRLYAHLTTLPDEALFMLPGVTAGEAEHLFRDASGSNVSVELFSESRLCALACSGTLPGDIILHTRFFTSIVRPLADKKFLVIGRAILLHGFVMPSMIAWTCGCWSRSKSLRSQHYQLRESIEAPIADVLASMVLDKINNRSFFDGSYSPETRVEILRQLAFINIPPIGTVLDDVRLEKDMELSPFPKDCEEHGEIDPKTVSATRGLLWLTARIRSGHSVSCISDEDNEQLGSAPWNFIY